MAAENACFCFVILLGMVSSFSASRVLISQEIDRQTSNSSKAGHKIEFSGGIGIGIGIGEGSRAGTGRDGTIGFGQGSGGGGGSGFGQGSGSGSGGGGGGGIGIGIGIGGGIEWRSSGKPGSGRPSECFVCRRELSSSRRCCPYKEVVGEECPIECFECRHSASGRCCPLEVTRKLQHERAMAGQKTAVPLSHQIDHAWAPSNLT